MFKALTCVKLNFKNQLSSLYWFFAVCILITTLVPQLSMANPHEKYKQEFAAAAEKLRNSGVPVELRQEKSESIIEISSGNLQGCRHRLCRALRMLQEIIGKTIFLELTFLPEGMQGRAHDRTVELDIRYLNFHELLTFNSYTVRHEIQHVLLSQNATNHYLNGWFDFIRGSILRYGDADGYGMLSVQEFFTMSDQNFKLPFNSENRMYLDGQFGYAVLDFLEGWANAYKKGRIETFESEEYNSFWESEKIDKEISKLLSKTEKDFIVYTTINDTPKTYEKYLHFVVAKNGNRYKFYSDLTYRELGEHVAPMLETLWKAARIWVKALWDDKPLDPKEMKKLKELFKTQDKYRFPNQCNGIFSGS